MSRAFWRSAILVGAVAASFTGLAQAAEVEGPKVNWKFSTWGNPRAVTKGAEVLAEIVSKKTGGNFTIHIGYGEQLSKARENLDSIKIGALDAAHFCASYHPAKTPAYMVFTLPFLPLGDWEVSKKVRERLYQHPALIADLDRWDAMVYVTTMLPQYEFLGRGDPPLKLSDWKGKRVRALGGLGDAMVALGAIKTTTTASEVYTSMQRGTMDAASFPFTFSHISFKIHEVSNWYTSNMSPGTVDCPYVFSKKSFAKLPKQYQDLLMNAREEVTRSFITAYTEIDKKNLPIIEKRLKKVAYTDAQLEEFRKIAGKPVWDKWVADNQSKFDAKGLLDLVFKTAAEAKK